jgi:hypothetical protein
MYAFSKGKMFGCWVTQPAGDSSQCYTSGSHRPYFQPTEMLQQGYWSNQACLARPANTMAAHGSIFCFKDWKPNRVTIYKVPATHVSKQASHNQINKLLTATFHHQHATDFHANIVVATTTSSKYQHLKQA